jgi:hypothetical protein
MCGLSIRGRRDGGLVSNIALARRYFKENRTGKCRSL